MSTEEQFDNLPPMVRSRIEDAYLNSNGADLIADRRDGKHGPEAYADLIAFIKRNLPRKQESAA